MEITKFISSTTTTSPLLSAHNNNNTNCSYEKTDNLETKIILMVVVMPTMAGIGLTGNVLSMILLLSRRLRGPNSIYLAALALCDSGLLIAALLIYTVEILYDYLNKPALYSIWVNYLKWAFMLSHVFQMGAVYMTVAATVERWFVISNRSYANSCTQSSTLVGIVTVFAGSTAFNLVKYWDISVSERTHCTGFARWDVSPSPLAQNHLYQTIYSLWLTSIVAVLFPFFTLLILNINIAFQIAKYADKTKRLQVNMIIVVVVSTFLICNAPSVVVTMIETINIQFLYQHDDFYSFMKDAVNILTIFNSSINFFIYIIFGDDFRKELRLLALAICYVVLTPLNYCCFAGRWYEAVEKQFREDDLLGTGSEPTAATKLSFGQSKDKEKEVYAALLPPAKVPLNFAQKRKTHRGPSEVEEKEALLHKPPPEETQFYLMRVPVGPADDEHGPPRRKNAIAPDSPSGSADSASEAELSHKPSPLIYAFTTVVPTVRSTKALEPTRVGDDLIEQNYAETKTETRSLCKLRSLEDILSEEIATEEHERTSLYIYKI